MDYKAWERGRRKFHATLRENVTKMFVQYLQLFAAYLVNVLNIDIKLKCIEVKDSYFAVNWTKKSHSFELFSGF